METIASTLHQGYRLIASACPAHGDLHTADLVIEKPGGALTTFVALDYFFDRATALAYATRWGRIWVDMRRQESHRA